MGLFGGKDDTKAKIEELKAKMQGQQQGQQQQQGWQPPQQPWQQQAPQQYQPPQQGWQQPEQPSQPAQQPELPRQAPVHEHRRESRREEFEESEEVGIVLDLGEGMSLNLPIRSHMRLDEFLRIADRVRELKKIEQPQQRY